VFLLVLSGWGVLAQAQVSSQSRPSNAPAKPQPAAAGRLTVTVMDENGVALPDARVWITNRTNGQRLQAETDHLGTCRFSLPAQGSYELHAEKIDFYAYDAHDVQLSPNQVFEVVLHHVQEFREQVEVTDSAPAIDPAQTSQSEDLTNREIFSLPYPTTRDYRNILPFLPGVIQDTSGQIHVGGSASYEVQAILDGFTMSQPAGGLLIMRVSTDAIRQISLDSSRYSAEYGKASGGVLKIDTGMGDDHYRWSATNFIPGVDFRNGVSLSDWDWTPRVNFSGPLHKNKAWFFEGADGEYEKGTVLDLPPGQNTTTSWRMSSLSKVQVNLTPSNILSGGILVNRAEAGEVGLSQFTPLESTVTEPESAYLATIKDSVSLASGFLLEAGVGVHHYETKELPQPGTVPYVLSPQTAEGNFYLTSNAESQRVQGIANLFFPRVHWHGRHEFQAGTDIDAISLGQSNIRRPIAIVNSNGTLNQCVTFQPGPPNQCSGANANVAGASVFDFGNYETSAYVQDRWSITDHLLAEAGLRFDRDHVVRQWVTAPRFAVSYMIAKDTKINAGVGLFFDRTNLNIITQPLAGERIDQFYAPDGVTPLGLPVTTIFQPSPTPLRAPRFANWSAGVQRKLPWAVYGRVEYLQKRGRDIFNYATPSPLIIVPGQPPSASTVTYQLNNAERDYFHSVRFTARKQFKGTYEVLGSYERSSATSNSVVNLNLDSLVFAQQAGGPQPWDAPNRFIAWGWFPLAWIPHMQKYDLAFSEEYRTGFPFSAVDQFQQLVGAPNSYRFPPFFALNLHLERRFRFHGYDWALRAGFNDITNHQNFVFVNNNISSAGFRTFSGVTHRSFTARIRLLSRK
jgi:hypothetical protein